MTQNELKQRIAEHKKWLNGEGGDPLVLSGADLRSAVLRSADLRGSDLRSADLRGADLRGAVLRGADLSDADLSDADLRSADLSGCTGLIDPIEYMDATFTKIAAGYIVYKTFGGQYAAPPKWDISPGAVITEVCNSNRTEDCGCGINVAPLDWVRRHYDGTVYKCLIRWKWLPGVVVPYNTDGKIRCSRLEIIEEAK